MYYGPMYGGQDWGIGILAFVLWFVVFVIIVAILVRVFGSGGHRMHYMEREDPLAIVKERYAKGEINKEQFEQLKKDLH